MFIDFDPTSEHRSLGEYLRSVREEKEITIDELAESTKIKRDYLDAIEGEKFEDLPTGPYLKLFLKSYSEALNIDYEKVSSYLEAVAAAKLSKAKPIAGKPIKEKRKIETKPPEVKPVAGKPEITPIEQKSEVNNYIVIIGIAIFVLFIGVMLFILLFKGSWKNTGAEEEKPVQTAQLQVTDSSTRIALQNFLNRFDSLIISIYPDRQQAITIISDGHSLTKLVTPGVLWRVSARDQISVSCEAPDSSKYYLNGYKLRTTQFDLAGGSAPIFDRHNWIEYVDTTLGEPIDTAVTPTLDTTVAE